MSQTNKSAQLAADLEMYKSALDRLGTNFRIVLNNGNYTHILRTHIPKEAHPITIDKDS